MFMARYQWIAARRIRQSFAFFPKFSDKIQRDLMPRQPDDVRSSEQSTPQRRDFRF
jgi:hypothetical protein